jgi:two-component system vancomycin resistance associated response regulator VraR
MNAKPKLLIVEDDPALGRSLQRGTRAYFEVIMKESVESAIDLIEGGEALAAAVVDIGLPDGTGFEVVETLRRQDRNLPVLILTGSNDPTTINRAHALRVEFVCKPFFSENLAQFVQRTLSGSQYGDRKKLAGVIDEVTKESGLSHRESQILAFAAEGIPRSRLADVMGVSENTVKSQVRSLLDKVEKLALSDVVWWVRSRAGL